MNVLRDLFERLKDTVKSINSGHLNVLKNLPVIKKLPLLGGSLTKIFIFGTKHFVLYFRCQLLGSFSVLLASDSFFFKIKFVTRYY